MQLELSTLAKLAEAGSKADQVRSCYRYPEAHRGFGDIVDAVFLQPEAVGLVWSVNQVNEVLALQVQSDKAPSLGTRHVQCSLQAS